MLCNRIFFLVKKEGKILYAYTRETHMNKGSS